MNANHYCDPEFHLPPDPELVPWTEAELEEQFKQAEKLAALDIDYEPTELPF